MLKNSLEQILKKNYKHSKKNLKAFLENCTGFDSAKKFKSSLYEFLEVFLMIFLKKITTIIP